MAGIKAEKPLITTTIQVFPDEWELFKYLCGHRQASGRLRMLMREDIIAAGLDPDLILVPAK